MSEDFDKIEVSGGKNRSELNFCTFFGGKDYGQMMQLTQGLGLSLDEPGHIQLTVSDAYKTIDILARWIKQKSELQAEKIKEMIIENQELEKTILKDAVECERFIKDLEILKIPLHLLEFGGK